MPDTTYKQSEYKIPKKVLNIQMAVMLRMMFSSASQRIVGRKLNGTATKYCDYDVKKNEQAWIILYKLVVYDDDFTTIEFNMLATLCTER